MMVRIFIFILATLLYGCSDEQPNKCTMTLSESLPLQFWPVTDSTFNDEAVCDIDSYPFYYEPNCNKDIKLKWSTSTDEGEYTIAFYDSYGEFVTRLFFTKTFIDPFYVYQVIFTPTSIGLCGECFRAYLESATESEESIVSNPEFESSLSPWTSEGPHSAQWIFGSSISGNGAVLDMTTVTQLKLYDFSDVTLQGLYNSTDAVNADESADSAGVPRRLVPTYDPFAFPGYEYFVRATIPAGTPAYFETTARFLCDNSVSGFLPSGPYKIKIHYRGIATSEFSNLQATLNIIFYDDISSSVGVSNILTTIATDGSPYEVIVEANDPSNWIDIEKIVILVEPIGTVDYLFDPSSNFDIYSVEYYTDEVVNTSDTLNQVFDVNTAGKYRLQVQAGTLDSGADPYNISVVVRNTVTAAQQTIYSDEYEAIDGIETVSFLVDINIDFNNIYLVVSSVDEDDPIAEIQVDYIRLTGYDFTELYKTDIIKPSTDTVCSVEVNYKTYNYFEGIVPVSGETYFTCFFPGRFFHERNKTEQKAIDLSNSRTINTASDLKKQKLLEVYDMPYYMHTKLQMILQYAISGSLLINGVEWTIEEDYAYSGDRPTTYPMQAASIYLTRRNFLVHNVI